jgi:hypothetical protein
VRAREGYLVLANDCNALAEKMLQLGARLTSARILEPIRRKLGVAHRVLYILVPQVGLQRPRVVAGIGERIAASVPEHVRVDREGHLGPRADAPEQRVEGLRRHRPTALGHEHVQGLPLLALQAPQSADFVPLQGMDAGRALLRSADV